MKPLRIPGIVAYAAMAMQLLQVAASPALAQTRAGDRIAEIRAALVSHGAPASARVTLAAPDAVLPFSDEQPIVFDSVSYNPATGRFLIRADAGANSAPIVVAGVAAVTATLPVPARDIARNEVIAETDLDWIETTDPGAAAFLADADLIIGKLARRPLAARMPLRRADLAAPVLIRRGATATIVLEAPGIRLTQNAVALANGGDGDLIAFRNINSNREIKAIVAGKDFARAPFRSATVAYLDQ